MLYSPIAECRLCHSTEITDILDLGPAFALSGVFPRSKLATIPAGPLSLVKCTNCGLVQLRHNYDLSMLYGETYGYRSGLNASMVAHLRSKVRTIESTVPLRPADLVIDIGSNDGTLLNSYTVPELRRMGVDPSGPKFQQYYTDDIELIPEFFSAAAIRQRTSVKARVITSIAMFYDLERPIGFVGQLLEVLADDGIWVFEQSYLPLMIDTNSYDTICHEHLEYYTLEQILYITQKLGLKIIALETNDVNGGSFSVTVARRSAPYPEAVREVEGLLAREVEAGYRGTQPFEHLRQEMGRHKEQLLSFLTRAKQQGKKVFGYGASTKGNILLQYCGITPDLLPCIAEVNQDKFGSFTPGTQIPIVAEAEARAQKPDSFLVLPWHFRKGIVQKESEYLSRGGSLVFPLPRLEIVALSAAHLETAR